MTIQQIVATVGLIAVLGGLAGYFAWRQLQVLRNLRGDDNLPPEDRRYVRNQARRRLVGCALMFALLGLFSGTFFFEGHAEQLGAEQKAVRDRGEEEREFTPEQKVFLKFYGGYWIAILLLVLGLVGIAFADLVAIRRYGQRHFRKLHADRRAMLERQVARLRQERNGHT